MIQGFKIIKGARSIKKGGRLVSGLLYLQLLGKIKLLFIYTLQIETSRSELWYYK